MTTNIDEDRKIIAAADGPNPHTQDVSIFDYEARTRWPQALDEIEIANKAIEELTQLNATNCDIAEALKAEVEARDACTALIQAERDALKAEVARLTDQRDTCWKDADTALIEDNIRLRGEIIHLKKVVEHTGAVAGAVARTLAGYEAANVRLREALEWALGFAADDYMLKQKIRAALDAAGRGHEHIKARP